MTPLKNHENIGLERGKKIKCRSASAAGSQHVRYLISETPPGKSVLVPYEPPGTALQNIDC